LMTTPSWARTARAIAAGPIAGWENVSVHLSDPDVGLRHIQITLDARGTLILPSAEEVAALRDLVDDIMRRPHTIPNN
jgi:hypothetical protein